MVQLADIEFNDWEKENKRVNIYFGKVALACHLLVCIKLILHSNGFSLEIETKFVKPPN